MCDARLRLPIPSFRPVLARNTEPPNAYCRRRSSLAPGICNPVPTSAGSAGTLRARPSRLDEDAPNRGAEHAFVKT